MKLKSEFKSFIFLFTLSVLISSCGGDNVTSPPPGGGGNQPQGIFILGSSLYLKEVDIITGSETPLHNYGTDPTYRNGLYIFWRDGVNNSYGLWKKDAQGTRHWLDIPVGIGSNPDPAPPRISHTGDYVSYDALCYHPITNVYGQYVLVYETSNPGNVNDVVRVLHNYRKAAWLPPGSGAPHGRLILMGYSDNGYNKIYVTDGQLLNPVEISWDTLSYDFPLQAEPSPDGTKLAVVTRNGDLYTATLNLNNFTVSNVTKVRTGNVTDKARNPVWSPDGKWIAHHWGTALVEPIWISNPLAETQPIVPGISGYTYSQIFWR
ncbi:MAG: hypothetical protein N2510_02410 [Ignavibacteria bacterium]|nr:hypothetical protein [Ignavibacteria bacterium]